MNKKKLSEAIILGTLIAGLLGVVVWQFVLKPPAAPAKPAEKKTTTTASNTSSTKTETKTDATPGKKAKGTKFADLSWVDQARVPNMIHEIKVTGHSPFADSLTPPKETAKGQIGSAGSGDPIIPDRIDTDPFPGGSGLTPASDIEPMRVPPPDFVLNGIVSTRDERYAAISVNGQYYTLLEGESIPFLGWTVARISTTNVILTKGEESLSLRLSGGSQK